MTRHRLLSGPTAVAAVLGALLVGAPAASADDASLFNAYNARQGDVDAASAVYLRAVKRLNRKPTVKRLRAIIAADHGINAVLTAIKSDLVGQTASSRHGRKARAAAFREVRWWRRGNNLEIRGIHALLHGHSGDRWFRRATHTMRRCYRQGRVAARHFKAVGLTSPLGPVSAN
jgi:hypothetical protein